MQDNLNKKDPRINYWRDVIARAKRHPVSCHAFCVEEGIPQASFYNWRDKLSKVAVSKSSLRLPTVFAEVKVEERLQPINQRMRIDSKWLADFVLHLHGGT